MAVVTQVLHIPVNSFRDHKHRVEVVSSRSSRVFADILILPNQKILLAAYGQGHKRIRLCHGSPT